MDALRRLALRGGDGRPDADLLADFLTRRDDGAFEALVRRHGPMVLAVCRRVLGNDADAEDAFQATFLVLARKAGQIAPPSAVGGWLHGVATTTALQARRTDRRRRARERRVAVAAREAAATPDDRERVWAVLDEELARLPAVYREAVVLCELEGRTLQQAADQLGCPVGTVASRLARGRSLLAGRLAGRGVALSGPLPAAVPLPAALVQVTVGGSASGSVLTLAEGVLKVMALKKSLSLFGACLIAGVLLSGAAFLSALGQEDPTRPPAPTAAKAPRPEPANRARSALAREVTFDGLDRLDTTLRDVVDLFKRRYDVTLTIDEKAFETEGVLDRWQVESVLDGLVVPVLPIPGEDAQLYYVLRHILARIENPSGAAFVVRGDAVEITTGAALAARKSAAEPPPEPSRQAQDRFRHAKAFLDTPVFFFGFDDVKTTLQEALEQVGKRWGVRFDVNEHAFRQERVAAVGRMEICPLLPIPTLRDAPGAQILDAVLAPCARVVPSGAVFVLRPNGEIEITTGAALKAEAGVGPRP